MKPTNHLAKSEIRDETIQSMYKIINGLLLR